MKFVYTSGKEGGDNKIVKMTMMTDEDGNKSGGEDLGKVR